MSNPYTSQTISAYNTSPPADDASAVSSNQLFWSKHKDKLADPIKTLSEAINTQALAAFAKYLGYSTSALSAGHTVVAADEWKVLSCTGTFTVTLLPAATAMDGFTLVIENASTGDITIEGDGSELVEGALNLTLDTQYDSVILQCDGSAWKVLARKFGVVHPFPRGHLFGIEAANNSTDPTNDLDFTEGERRSDDNTANLTIGAETRAIDAVFAEGGPGFRDSTDNLTGAKTFHLYAIGGSGKTDDLFASTSLAPTLPSGFTYKRRVFSWRWTGTAWDLGFQDGDDFTHDAILTDFNATSGTGNQLVSLSVPIGFPVSAKVFGGHAGGTTAGGAILITDPQAAATVAQVTGRGHSQQSPNPNSGTWQAGTGAQLVRTDSLGRVRLDAATSLGTRIYCEGWSETRGRYS